MGEGPRLPVFFTGWKWSDAMKRSIAVRAAMPGAMPGLAGGFGLGRDWGL
jgi:hypothetical protein